METRDWVWAAIVIIGVLITWITMRQAHITMMQNERRRHERCYQKLEWYESQALLTKHRSVADIEVGPGGTIHPVVVEIGGDDE